MKIGIDLGTTNSAMAVFTEDGEVEILENEKGDKTTPSVILVEEDDEDGDQLTIGKSAVRKRRVSPDRVLDRTKQYIDSSEEKTWEIDGKEHTPRDAASYILGHLFEQAERRLEEEVTGAVITVPYDFGATGRRATEDAAKLAWGEDFEVHQVINEPTAASLAYVHQMGTTGTVLVYDLGGGTFDATLAKASPSLIQVISTEGDRKLGGEDLDDELYEHVRQKIIDEGLTDPEDVNAHTRASLRKDITEAKEDLSDTTSETIVFEADGDVAEISISRSEFEAAITEKIDTTFDKIETLFEKDAVVDAGITPDDIDHVLLVGGSTRIPLVHDRVKDFFDVDPKLSVNADTAIAEGAALKAAEYSDLDPENIPRIGVEDVLSHSIGLEDNERKFNLFLEADTGVPEDETMGPYTNPQANPKHLDIPVWNKAEDGQGLGDLDEDPDDSDAPERIGGLTFEDIGDVEAGEMRIDVTFEAEPDGTLKVSAEETEVLNRTIETTIEGLGLSKEQIRKRREGEESGTGVDLVDEFTGVSEQDEDEEDDGDDD